MSMPMSMSMDLESSSPSKKELLVSKTDVMRIIVIILSLCQFSFYEVIFFLGYKPTGLYLFIGAANTLVLSYVDYKMIILSGSFGDLKVGDKNIRRVYYLHFLPLMFMISFLVIYVNEENRVAHVFKILWLITHSLMNSINITKELENAIEIKKAELSEEEVTRESILEMQNAKLELRRKDSKVHRNKMVIIALIFSYSVTSLVFSLKLTGRTSVVNLSFLLCNMMRLIFANIIFEILELEKKGQFEMFRVLRNNIPYFMFNYVFCLTLITFVVDFN